MGFRSGRAAWQRFRVKSAPQLTETELFAKLGDAVVPESFDVAPPDTIAGWCGGRHLLDRTFDADNLFGDAVLMGFVWMPLSCRPIYAGLGSFKTRKRPSRG